ncbi:MAG: NAD(P)-dependent oxidoreductase [Candidatus Tectomicrobia bacterium]|uniref:NAD(P)-dependent oxidoreductase n=1 Tax=Tectimicrobiota bacterium TaxID=2528274 RepID=A0A937W2Q5_UNCTE|nr:NAD(P)-dependent oxidoreductase [Candidatus Tectomicrobia bacterium]
MQLGFVGTGTMGNPMARCLLEAGHTLTVHDRRREAATALEMLGARWADTPGAVAAASAVVFTSLPGPAEVEQAVLDPSTGILAGLQPGSAYIDMTTNTPQVVRSIAERCRARGIAMLDAPVSGRPPGMTIMVGGDAATFTTYQPLLALMGRHIFYVGEMGAGCIAKLVTQYLGYTNFITALEGLLIGAKAGIDLGTLAQIVPLSAGASRTFDNIPRAVFTGAFTAGGTLDIVAKDVHLACELAREVGAPAHLGLLADDVLQRAQAQGWGQQGFPIVARILEAMAGVELRAPTATYEVGYQAHDPRRGEVPRPGGGGA